MDFELNEEQVMLRDSVLRFGADYYPSTGRTRALERRDLSSRDGWRTMARMGWLGLPTEEALGGAGGNAVHVMALMEGFGRHLILEPYATSCVFGGSILAAAGRAVALPLLDALHSGDTIVAPALVEPGAGFDLNRVSATAVRTEAGYRLSGEKGSVRGRRRRRLVRSSGKNKRQDRRSRWHQPFSSSAGCRAPNRREVSKHRPITIMPGLFDGRHRRRR